MSDVTALIELVDDKGNMLWQERSVPLGVGYVIDYSPVVCELILDGVEVMTIRGHLKVTIEEAGQ
jgi:hypothetical protein